jgi:hypothetical protein
MMLIKLVITETVNDLQSLGVDSDNDEGQLSVVLFILLISLIRILEPILPILPILFSIFSDFFA